MGAIALVVGPILIIMGALIPLVVLRVAFLAVGSLATLAGPLLSWSAWRESRDPLMSPALGPLGASRDERAAALRQLEAEAAQGEWLRLREWRVALTSRWMLWLKPDDVRLIRRDLLTEVSVVVDPKWNLRTLKIQTSAGHAEFPLSQEDCDLAYGGLRRALPQVAFR